MAIKVHRTRRTASTPIPTPQPPQPDFASAINALRQECDALHERIDNLITALEKTFNIEIEEDENGDED